MGIIKQEVPENSGAKIHDELASAMDAYQKASDQMQAALIKQVERISLDPKLEDKE